MKIKYFFTLTASIALVGLTHIIPVIAGEGANDQVTKEKLSLITDLRSDTHSELNYERLQSLAKKNGLSVDGKSIEMIQQDIRDKLIQEKAKELGISMEGKSVGELGVELKSEVTNIKLTKTKDTVDMNEYRLRLGNRDQALVNKTTELGIETENKNIESIQREVLDRMLKSKAKELGISTEGKDLESIELLLKDKVDVGGKK